MIEGVGREEKRGAKNKEKTGKAGQTTEDHDRKAQYIIKPVIGVSLLKWCSA